MKTTTMTMMYNCGMGWWSPPEETTMAERSQPIKRLADALHDCVEPPGRAERTERLADALQACLNEATRTGAEVGAKAGAKAGAEAGAKVGAKAAIEEIKREFEPRFDKQDATLRLI